MLGSATKERPKRMRIWNVPKLASGFSSLTLGRCSWEKNMYAERPRLGPDLSFLERRLPSSDLAEARLETLVGASLGMLIYNYGRGVEKS